MRTALAALLLLAGPAAAHDIYAPLREGMSPAGRLCCGGDPVTGDCEAVDYQMLRSGDAVILSKRYGGKPRTVPVDQPPADDPDPAFTTFCIFIRPGGV